MALAAKLRDSSTKVAEVAWAAIQKRLDDADPDVNRVWLEEVRCIHLNPSVRSEAGSGRVQTGSALGPKVTVLCVIFVH